MEILLKLNDFCKLQIFLEFSRLQFTSQKCSIYRNKILKEFSILVFSSLFTNNWNFLIAIYLQPKGVNLRYYINFFIYQNT